MHYTTATLVILVLSGLIITWMGWRIRFKKDFSLINGLGRKDPKDFKDPEKIASLIGGSTLLMGLATIAVPFASMQWGKNVWWAYIGVVVGLTAFSLIRVRPHL